MPKKKCLQFLTVSTDFRYSGHMNIYIYFIFFLVSKGIVMLDVCLQYYSSSSIPAVLQEKRTRLSHKVSHFLADTVSAEQAVRAAEVLAPQNPCRQLFAEQCCYRRAHHCAFSCWLTQIPSFSATSKKLFRHMFVLAK